MMKQFARLFKEEEGQGLTEYGLLVGLIAVAMIGMIGLFKDELNTLFNNIKNAI